MKQLRKFVATPLRFKLLLLEAFINLWAVSLVLALTLRRRTRFLMRTHRVSSQLNRFVPSAEEICRSIEAAAAFVPAATCLVKAQAGCRMLNRFGYRAEIKIGILKNSSDLQAHAWLECDGAIVMGSSGNQYVQLPVGQH